MRFLHPMMCGTARSHTLEDPLTLNIITLKGLYTGHVSQSVSRDQYTALPLVGVLITSNVRINNFINYIY